MGGGNAIGYIAHLLPNGLSPRGRGKPYAIRRAANQPGSIPAWAGETPDVGGAIRVDAVYPRVGGGNEMPITAYGVRDGLSPRGRGKQP